MLRIKQFSAQLWRIVSIMVLKTQWISILTWFLVDILENCQGNKRNFHFSHHSSPLHTCEKKGIRPIFFSTFIFALFACVSCYSWKLLSIELVIKTCVRKRRLMSVALIGIFKGILLFSTLSHPPPPSHLSLSLSSQQIFTQLKFSLIFFVSLSQHK